MEDAIRKIFVQIYIRFFREVKNYPFFKLYTIFQFLSIFYHFLNQNYPISYYVFY